MGLGIFRLGIPPRSASRYLSGWELGSIFSAHTGVPITAKVNSDIAFTENSRVNSSAGGQRPNSTHTGLLANSREPDNTNYII